MENKNSLSQKLTEYISGDYLPMHMPGHKRNLDVVCSAFKEDITEIDGFDNYHHPEDIIADIEERAAKVWGANFSLISVNGSSGLILSSILAAAKNKKAIVAANCHISVWHGLELAGITPIVIKPEVDSSKLYYGKLSPLTVREALSSNPDVDFIIYTSPTYEGIESDSKAIYDIACDYNVPVILDEAHGAHFGLGDDFLPTGTADIVIKSIHKTLNAPTQTAVLLGYSDRISRKLVTHYIDVTTTTSPSYILMAGIDRAIKDATNSKLYSNWNNAIDWARKELSKLINLTLVDTSDKSKFVIHTNGFIHGDDLSDLYRQKYHIELEASYPHHIIAMTGVGDTHISLERFVAATLNIDQELNTKSDLPKADISSIPTLQINLSIDEALKAPSLLLDLDNATEKIAAEYLFAYPPGVPILVPGAPITQEIVNYIKEASKAGVSYIAEPRRTWDKKVLTVDT